MQTTEGMTRAQANAARSTCTACHQRKVKCDAHDRGYPCSRCVKSGSAADCRLHRKNKRVSRARQQARQSIEEKTVKPLSPAVPSPVEESIVAAERTAATPGSLFLQTVIASDARQSTSKDGQLNEQLEGSPHPHTPTEPQSYSDAGATGGGTVGSAASTTTASTPAVLPTHGADGEYKKYLVEFIDQPQLAERPIDKTARILYVGSELSNIHFLLRQRMARSTTNEPSEENVKAKSTDGKPAKRIVHFPTNRISKPSAGLGGLAADGLPLEAFQLPPKRTVDQLLAAYLQHINPGFPVVDGRLLMRQYRARDPQNPPSLLLLQAILVAGAHVFYTDPDERAAHKAVFFRRAKMLLDARVERNRDTVVQAALLLTWHADGPEDVAANAWHWVGLAARTATGLGMHRDADGSTLVAHNKRMWRRVWWLLVACDVLVALQYGRPPAIHLDDTDVLPLTAGDFVDCGEGTRIEYVLHLVQLCVLLSTHVLRRQFRPVVSAVAGAVSLRRTDEALANWSLHLPPSLQLGGHGNGDYSSSPTSSKTNVWTAFLHLTYNTALLLLHRQSPSLASASTSKATIPSADDVEICTNAAVAIQQIFHAVCSSGQAVYLWSSAINSLFTALIQLSGDVQRSTTSSSTADPTGNPLLAVAALRRYDAALSSLRQLAVYWPNAQAVVQFFEQSVRTAPMRATTATADDTTTSLPTITHSSANTTTVDSTDITRATTPLPPQDPTIPDIEDSVLSKDNIPRYNSQEDMQMIMEPVVDSMHPQIPHEPADNEDDLANHLLSGLVAASRQIMPFEGGHPQHMDAWNTGANGVFNTDWQRIYWQQPELTDDFLFNF
ncbi:hypothetical protein SEUCBS140593_010592 [Sporothrix eucalyptigena]|uniref:Zn(2)-C6 fungal-type domain-containing protein n=1 Tax=Sporothrix eucalyptigena TaxID=1812306 RepID=A0ABP0D4K6_9PEZI